MKLLTFLFVIVGLLLQYAYAEEHSAVMGQGATSPSSKQLSELYLAKNCKRRVAISVRDFVNENLSSTPRPVGYLVSSLGVTRWIQSLQMVPQMIPKNAELIQKNSKPVADLLKMYGTGDISHGLTRLVEKVGVIGKDGMTAEKSLYGFFDLGAEQSQQAFQRCLIRSYSGTSLGKDACTSYDTTGEAGLKLLSIKLFTNMMKKSPIGRFAMRYGGLHGLAKRDAKFQQRLATVVHKTRFGTLIKRVGGMQTMLEKIASGSHGLEAVSWTLFGPKLWEKVSQCSAGTGFDYVRKESWKGLTSLSKNTKYIDSLPASGHYTYQFWVKPQGVVAASEASIMQHGNTKQETSPSINTCKNGLGLRIMQMTQKGQEGITCSPPLTLNTCTLVTLTNRNGEMRLYYDDKLVQRAITSKVKSVNAPVYFGNPWETPANMAVYPISVLARSITDSEIEYQIAKSYHVCGNQFPKHLIERFSYIRKQQLGYIETSLLSVGQTTLDKSKVDANLLHAQEIVCRHRIEDIATKKFVLALKDSPIAPIFSKYQFNLQSFLDAGVTGEINASELQEQISKTKLGTQLQSIGGLTKLFSAYRLVNVNDNVHVAYGRVQNLIYTLGGGKLAVGFDRCVEKVNINISQFDINKAISAEACVISNNWGRPALSGYGVQLFERALARSRVGHLYRYYGNINSFATAIRSNPILESKIGALLYNTEFGTLLAKSVGVTKDVKIPNVQNGFSTLLTAIMTSSDALHVAITSIIGDKIAEATKACPELNPVQQTRSRCRQRIIRQAMEEFYAQLDKSTIKQYMLQAYKLSAYAKSNAAYIPLYGIDSLKLLSANTLIEIDSHIKNTPIGKLILPVGGISSIARAAKSHAEMQQLVWKLYKLRLLPEVDKCVATISVRTAREAGFTEQCRLRVRDFYMNRFQNEINSSVLGKFVTKFGGFEGIVTHEGNLLTRLASLVETHAQQQPIVFTKDQKPLASINNRIQRVGGLIVVFETVRRDASLKSFQNLVLDMYGKSAQLALDHCELHASNAAVASTSEFLTHLKTKMSDITFKPILNRFLLNVHKPFLKNAAGKELDMLSGVSGLIQASQSGNDRDLNQYIVAKLNGVNMKQTALYPWLKSIGFANGLRVLNVNVVKRVDVLNKLKCHVLNRTWLSKIMQDMGGCETVLRKITQMDEHGTYSLVALDELALSNLKRKFEQTGLHGLLGSEAFDNSLMVGNLETSLKTCMMDVFSSEYSQENPAVMKDMITKILIRMNEKKEKMTASLLESATVDEQTLEAAKATPEDKKLPLPPTATMSDPNEKPPAAIHNVPARCPNQCSGRGTCVQNTGKVIPAPSGKTMLHPYECVCDLGWTGTGCEVYIDQFVRFLLGKGAYELPKCCDTCKSQTQASVDGRFIPANSVLPKEVSDECSKPEWISDPALRAKCVEQILKSRQRYTPRAMDKVVATSFMELESRITSTPFEQAERVFENTMSQQYKQRDAKKYNNNVSLLTTTSQEVMSNSAAAMFPKKTMAQIAMEQEAARHNQFYLKHGGASFLSKNDKQAQTSSAKTTTNDDGSAVASVGFSDSLQLKYDTSFLHIPQDLAKVNVEPCCIPCDEHPDKIQPKTPLRPQKLMSIREQMALKAKHPDSIKMPHDQTVGDAMAITAILKKRGLPASNPYKRRGPVVEVGSFVEQMKDPDYVRKSLRGPLLSEEVKHKVEENCCNICPFKQVKGLPWKKPVEPSTPAVFLEEDSVLLAKADDGMINFLQEAVEMYSSPDISFLELGYDKNIDGSVSMRDVGESFAEQHATVASNELSLDELNRNAYLDKAVHEYVDRKATDDVSRKLGFWWDKLQPKNVETRPDVPDITNINLRINPDIVKASPFLPRVPTKTPGCCNVCPSVFTLRTAPRNPWDDQGPAFELLK